MTSLNACVSEVEQALKSTMAMLSKVAGAAVIHVNMQLNFTDLVRLNAATGVVMTMGFKEDLEGYMAGLAESPVRTLRDVVEWNEAHAVGPNTG
jgi:amidase